MSSQDTEQNQRPQVERKGRTGPPREQTDPLGVPGFALPRRETVASTTLFVLLFGGVVALFSGLSLWVYGAFGLPASVSVVGVGLIAVALVLGRVLRVAGWV